MGGSLGAWQVPPTDRSVDVTNRTILTGNKHFVRTQYLQSRQRERDSIPPPSSF